MAKLNINQKLVTPEVFEQLSKICPFNAFEYNEKDNILDTNSGCKMCKLCVKKGPQGVMSLIEEEVVLIDKTLWSGIAVWIEISKDKIHNVSLELLGKAKSLADSINQKVFAVVIGENTQEIVNTLLEYNVDTVYNYDNKELNHFDVEKYANCMQHFIDKVKPSSILYGATSYGRSLAPRLAARNRTGLTADCTILEVKENSDLIQIRPAFGGNIMAQIICPNHRPQMATVRYKIFKLPEKTIPHGNIENVDVNEINLNSNSSLIEITQKDQQLDISEAEVIVACGRAFQTEEQLSYAEELAQLVGGVVAVTRPLVEAGLKDPRLQIGLSGRTVAPKLIFNLGISGTVQYMAGMTSSETIITINKDATAPIFDVSHYGIVGDVFEILPKLINNIKESRK